MRIIFEGGKKDIHQLKLDIVELTAYVNMKPMRVNMSLMEKIYFFLYALQCLTKPNKK